MDEADGVAMAAVIPTDEALGLRHPGIEAETDTVNPHLDAISILTCRPAVIEAVVHPVPPLALDLGLGLLPVRRGVDTVIDLVTAVACAPHLRPRNGEVEKSGAVQIMVIDTRPILPLHPAHQLPEENKADGVLSPAS